MNQLVRLLLFLAITPSIPTGAYAQTNKSPLPVDNGVLNVAPPFVPSDIPPKTDPPSPEKVFSNPYLSPEYPGGTSAMYRFIESNLKIPIQAKEAGISGRVFLSFYVQVSGELTDITVLKGLGFGCDEEAIRVVQLMPRWKPGKRLSEPMKVKYNLPILFNTQ